MRPLSWIKAVEATNMGVLDSYVWGGAGAGRRNNYGKHPTYPTNPTLPQANHRLGSAPVGDRSDGLPKVGLPQGSPPMGAPASNHIDPLELFMFS